MLLAGCYGVDGESDSIMSSASENSTEPWFCDACKCGAAPSCELCPNMDGIFKETDAGRFVSLSIKTLSSCYFRVGNGYRM